MVLFYVTQIKLHRFDGAFTIDNVPARWRDAVLAKLTEDDIAEVEALAQAYYDALDAEDKANAYEN